MVGVAAACRAVGRPRASDYRHRRQQPAATPARATATQAAASRAGGGRAASGAGHAAQPAVRRPGARRGVRHAAGRGRLPRLERTMYRLLRGRGRESASGASRPPTRPREAGAARHRARTRSGAGTSPSCSARPSGPTSTCTSSSTSTAATSSAGWSPHREHAELAERLIAETIAKQDITRRAADPPRRPRLLDDLQAGRVPARRPRRHQDPLPTARLATTTPTPRRSSRPSSTGPGFPDRFASIEDARAFCQDFFRWYNAEHRHSGIGLLPPADRPLRPGQQAATTRSEVLDRRLRRSSRALRPPAAPAAAASDRRLDQPARDTGGCSVIP